MPRTGRGGSRNGAPGTAYSNRTDLNVAAAPAEGRAHGAVSADLAAQQAVPMGPPPGTAAPNSLTPSPVASPLPGELTPLDAPSLRPSEPVTAGAPVGPGPGPDALATSPKNRGRDVLARAAVETGDPYLAHILKTLGG